MAGTMGNMMDSDNSPYGISMNMESAFNKDHESNMTSNFNAQFDSRFDAMKERDDKVFAEMDRHMDKHMISAFSDGMVTISDSKSD